MSCRPGRVPIAPRLTLKGNAWSNDSGLEISARGLTTGAVETIPKGRKRLQRMEQEAPK